MLRTSVILYYFSSIFPFPIWLINLIFLFLFFFLLGILYGTPVTSSWTRKCYTIGTLSWCRTAAASKCTLSGRRRRRQLPRHPSASSRGVRQHAACSISRRRHSSLLPLTYSAPAAASHYQSAAQQSQPTAAHLSPPTAAHLSPPATRHHQSAAQ